MSSTGWATRATDDGGPTAVQWCDGKERGIFTEAFQLGRVRPAVAGDLATLPVHFGDYSLSGLDQAFAEYSATLEAPKDGKVVLVLTQRDSPADQVHIVVDTGRNVITRIERHTDGKATSVTKFDDFVEAAGCWWARRIETTDDKGRVSAKTTLTVKPLAGDDLAKQLKDVLAGREAILFVNQPLKRISAAKTVLAEKKASARGSLCSAVALCLGAAVDAGAGTAGTVRKAGGGQARAGLAAP